MHPLVGRNPKPSLRLVQPDAFYLIRLAETGEVIAYSAWLRLHSPPEPEEIAADPVAAAIWRHCDARGPVRPGDHLAVSCLIVAKDLIVVMPVRRKPSFSVPEM